MNVKVILSLMVVTLVFSACSLNTADVSSVSQGFDPAVATSAVPSGYGLVWADEFDGSGQPDSANWNYEVGNGYNPGLHGFQGWGNGEWEWYRPENCYQSGGNAFTI